MCQAGVGMEGVICGLDRSMKKTVFDTGVTVSTCLSSDKSAFDSWISAYSTRVGAGLRVSQTPQKNNLS